MIVMEGAGGRQLAMAVLGAYLQNLPEGTLWKTSEKIRLVDNFDRRWRERS
jgi:hypothetical protein